ncbi:MAG: hypothetical protein AAB738_00535 [Patescibacteria group bacterium]
MDLIKLLKQLNKMEPDLEYTRRSKLAILGLLENNPKRTAWGLMWSGIKFSTGSMVTGLVIVLIFVAFSAIKFSSPTPLAALDPITLRAEAEAIDIQIKLATLGYENPSLLINQSTTLKIVSGASSKITVDKNETKISSDVPAVKDGAPTSTVDSPTIDEVLGKLSE